MATVTYNNPVVAGFAPDPSAIYVEEEQTYFIVNSSFHLFPGLPIYASKNLRDWSHIGNAINRPEQLPLHLAQTGVMPWEDSGDNLVAAGGLFAGTIRYFKGTYYIISTVCFQEEGVEGPTFRNFYVHTTDIWSDKWTDPVWVDFSGIDTSLYFDDDDKAYVQGCWRAGPMNEINCTIRQMEIDVKTGKALGEAKFLWEGYAGLKDVEAPHIYKKDGYYYLLTAECGCFEHHTISMARSKSIWGPYESAPSNPILTAHGKPEQYIQHTGHGDLFQDSEERWWCVCVGVRDENGVHPMGRETVLTPVEWPVGEFPRIELPKMQFSRESPSPFPVPEIKAKSGAEYVYIRNPNLKNYDIGDSVIKLVPSNDDLNTVNSATTFVGERQRQWNSTAKATLCTKGIKAGTAAGLSLFKDDFRNVNISYKPGSSILVLEQTSVPGTGRVTKALATVELKGEVPARIGLQIDATKEAYTFSYNLGSELKSIGSVTALEITARDFTGPVFGIFANKTTAEDAMAVTFERFEVL